MTVSSAHSQTKSLIRLMLLNDSFNGSIRSFTCAEMIGMSVTEYEAIREQGNRFAVAPGDSHVWPDVETVVEKRDRYWVVEKFGYGGMLAAKHDPRSDGAR
jgi:hypothetical protein